MDCLFWWPLEENLQNSTSNAAPTKTVPISSVGPVHGPSQPLTRLCKFLPLDLFLLQLLLALQLRKMVTKSFCIYLHSPLWLHWSIKGLLLFFWALLIPSTYNFLPTAPSLTSRTPSPQWSSSCWCLRAHSPPSPPLLPSSTSGSSRQILHLFLPLLSLLCICLRCTTTAHSMARLIAQVMTSWGMNVVNHLALASIPASSPDLKRLQTPQHLFRSI